MSKRKMSSSPNRDITSFLIELANYERNTNRNIHKYNAYRKAATVCSVYDKRIESGKEAKKLSGIGTKISKKIDEYLKTGTLAKLEQIRKDDMNVILNLLNRVSGIGPAKAIELYKLGIRSLSGLQNHQNMLTHHQKIGLRYFKDFEQLIPRDEIKKAEKIIKKCIKKLDEGYTFTICGSYRRGQPETGDLDILITHPSFEQYSKKPPKALIHNLVRVLEDENFIIDTMALGESKYMGVCRLNPTRPARRIDIRLCAVDEYPCAVLYFTGSDVFNVRMRHRALDLGYTLNEHCLRPIGCTGIPGEPCLVTCEEDIFSYLDMKYVAPKDRNM